MKTLIKVTMITTIILTAVLLASCSSKTLKKDPFLLSTKANYHSILFSNAKESSLGLLGIQAPLKGAFSFTIQGIHNGTVFIYSEECNISDFIKYKDSQKINLTYNPLMSRCLIFVTIMPEFTEEESNGIQWSSLTGIVIVKRDIHSTILNTIQTPTTSFNYFSYTAREDNTTAFFKGCGELIDEKQSRGLHTYLYSTPMAEFCILEGFYKNKSENITVINLLSTYLPHYLPLPKPKILIAAGILTLSTSIETSLIIINSRTHFTNELTTTNFNFPLTIIMYSSSGRVAYCTYKSKENGSCLN